MNVQGCVSKGNSIWWDILHLHCTEGGFLFNGLAGFSLDSRKVVSLHDLVAIELAVTGRFNRKP